MGNGKIHTLASRLLTEQAHSRPLVSPLQLAKMEFRRVVCITQRGHFLELKLSLLLRNSDTRVFELMCSIKARSSSNRYSAPIESTDNSRDGSTSDGSKDGGCRKGRW